MKPLTKSIFDVALTAAVLSRRRVEMLSSRCQQGAGDGIQGLVDDIGLRPEVVTFARRDSVRGWREVRGHLADPVGDVADVGAVVSETPPCEHHGDDSQRRDTPHQVWPR